MQGQKQIEDTVDKPYYDRMYQKVHGKTGRRMKKLRSATVEPVLGTLLDFQGMRKVYTKGICLANKHVLLACTAYNLKKLMRFKSINSIVQVMKTRTMELKSTLFPQLNFEDLLFWSLLRNNTQNKNVVC
jgi:hypothetical protein